MGHSIALNFEDGVTRFIECGPDETIADASYRVGINIPLDCRDGVCGTCKCRVEAGEYDRGSYLEDALHEEEAAEGLALVCQTRPRTDLVVAVAASSEACKTSRQTYLARLRSVDRLSETTMAFSLDRADAFTFLPGQYVNALVPGTDQRRSYSLSSPPSAETLSFLVRNIPAGVMSTYLRDKAVFAGRVHRPGRQLLSARNQTPAAAPGGRHRPRSVPVHAWENRRDWERAPDSPGLRRHQRRRPREHRAAGGIRDQNPWLHVLHLRGGRRQRPSAQGLCHGPCRG
jgi:ferredoxin